MVFTCRIETVRATRLGTVVPRNEGVNGTRLIVQIVSHINLITWTAFELAQDLIVALAAHHDLTMDVLNVVVFTAVPSIRSHQRRLVSDANVVDSGCRCRMLQ